MVKAIDKAGPIISATMLANASWATTTSGNRGASPHSSEAARTPSWREPRHSFKSPCSPCLARFPQPLQPEPQFLFPVLQLPALIGYPIQLLHYLFSLGGVL